MAAAFGRMQGESNHLQDPIIDGYITKDATPWAIQFQEDFNYWCEAIEDVDAFFSEYEYKYFNVFLDSQVKEGFLLLDPTILRAWEQSVMIPYTALPNTDMIKKQTQTSSHSHHCNLCCISFPTFKQLRIHETTRHNIRCMATLLTPTNCCPNCNTIFASQASAIHHLKNAMRKGYCTSHRSHTLQQLIIPTHLHCAYCMALDTEQILVHEDLDRLHQHIKTSHLFDLPICSQHVRYANASMDEEKPRKRVRRSWGKKGRGKKEIQEQVMDMIAALQIAHITNDRETRENSGALRTVALIFTDPRGDLPKWVKAGIEENEAWLKEMKERPGENIGSPHVRVCLIALHALITSEEIQQQKFEQSLKGLKE